MKCLKLYDSTPESRKRTLQTILEGIQLIQISKGMSNKLSKQTESTVAHIRQTEKRR